MNILSTFNLRPVSIVVDLVIVHLDYGGVMVIITAQPYSTKSKLRLCAGSGPAHGVVEV